MNWIHKKSSCRIFICAFVLIFLQSELLGGAANRLTKHSEQKEQDAHTQTTSESLQL